MTIGPRIVVYGSGYFTEQIVNTIITQKYYTITMWIGRPDCSTFSHIFPATIDDLITQRGNYDSIVIIEDLPLYDDKFFLLRCKGIRHFFVLIKESKKLFDYKGRFACDAIQEFTLSEDRAALRYLEMHLVDHCNLRCKGCTHFSNIVTEPQFASVASLEQQFKRISELFEISVLRLLGGEPFLHPDVALVLSCARQYFPKAKIFVVTNGLLLPKIEAAVCSALVKNSIALCITRYKPTDLIADKIKSVVEENNIECYWGNGELSCDTADLISHFHTCLSMEKQGGAEVKKCYNQYCWFLKDGRLSKCPYPLLIHYINHRFGCMYYVEQEDFIDIFSCVNGWDAVAFLNNQIPFCQYCRLPARVFKWAVGYNSVSLDDYLVESKPQLEQPQIDRF